MLTGFGAYGQDLPIPADRPPPQPQTATISMLGQALLTEKTPYACDQTVGDETYCLSSQEYLDKQKYMHLGIGAAAGVAVGALAVYFATR